MMVFKKLFSWLFVSSKSTDAHDHPDLHPLVFEDLKKELNIDLEARRLARAGLPETDATSLSSPEMKIIHRLEAVRANYKRWALERISDIHEGLNTFDITQLVNRSRQYAEEYERLANKELSDAELKLGRRRNAAERHTDDLDAFRKEHELTRQAHYPVSKAARFGLVLLGILLIIVEGGFNAFFFAQGSEMGMLGGFIQAGTLAAMNFIVPALLGRLLIPKIHHVRLLQRVLGYAGVALAVAFMLLSALAIAHVRDAMSLAVDDTVDTAAMALKTLLEAPLDLAGLSSWMLFFLSFLFGCCGLFEGYKYDDPYPGFGRRHRMAQTAIDDYHALVEQVRDEITGIKEMILESLNRDVEKAKVYVLDFGALVEDKRSSELKLKYHLSKAENMLHTLVMAFRDENKMHRNGVARPAYFDSTPEFQHLDFPSFDTVEDVAAHREQEKLLNTLLADVEGIRAAIQSAYDNRFDQLKAIHLQL